MFKRILVAIDGSESSIHALQQTLTLAQAERSTVQVISVVPPYQGELRLVGVKKHVSEILTDPYRRALAAASEAAKAAGAVIETTLEEGEPYEKIVDAAKAKDCDLIVVGVRGRNPAEEILMGSMTERVIGYSHLDVLVIPLGKDLRTDKIVVAVDGSDESNRGVRLAFDFQRFYGSRIDVLAVADVPFHVYGISAELAHEIIGEARKELERMKEKSQSEGITAEFILREGQPSKILIDYAQSSNSGLIIIGSHGRTGLKRLLMGSVAARVIGRSPCPVLVART